MAKRTSVVEFLKAYKLFLAAVSLNKVHIIFSNKNILDAMEGRSKLHMPLNDSTIPWKPMKMCLDMSAIENVSTFHEGHCRQNR